MQENAITNRYANGKLDAAYDLGGGLTFKTGGAYKKFTNTGYTWANKVFHNVPANIVVPNSMKQLVKPDTLLQYIVGNVDAVSCLCRRQA